MRMIIEGKKWEIECEDSSIITGDFWYEKSKDKSWIKLPKDNVTGRGYISVNEFNNKSIKGIYSFENKTSDPRVLGSGGWKSKMTDEEKLEVEEIEKRLEEIKSDCQKREAKKLTQEELLLLEIEKVQKKLDKLRGQK